MPDDEGLTAVSTPNLKEEHVRGHDESSQKDFAYFLQPAILWESVYRLRRAAYNYGTFEDFNLKCQLFRSGIYPSGVQARPFHLWLGKF